MTLFPARVLPVNDAHGGPFLIRVDIRANKAAVFVRRESDKKTWSCMVRSLQEILAPTQQARALDLIAVVTCLYHGVGYDTTALHTFGGAPLELTRREVAFSQPETWTDDQYRLTTRISFRNIATANAVAATEAPSAPPATDADSSAEVADVIPVVEMIQDEDIVFGLNFEPSNVNIEQLPSDDKRLVRLTACMRLLSPTFPNACLNWANAPVNNFVHPIKDGLLVTYSHHALDVEVTLDVVHTKGPALCVVSFGAHLLKPSNTATFQATPQSDLYHTVLQFDVVHLVPNGVLQVAVLPGAACVLGGTTLTLRELAKTILETNRGASALGSTSGLPGFALRPGGV